MDDLRNKIVNLHATGFVDFTSFSVDGMTLLQFRDESTDEDVEFFSKVYENEIKSMVNGVLISRDKGNGPMNTKDGALTVIQIAIAILHYNRCGQRLVDFSRS